MTPTDAITALVLTDETRRYWAHEEAKSFANPDGTRTNQRVFWVGMSPGFGENLTIIAGATLAEAVVKAQAALRPGSVTCSPKVLMVTIAPFGAPHP